MPKSLRRIVVHPVPGHRSRGILQAGTAVFACALGRSGIRALKKEGDGGTPLATLPLRRVFFRKDRRVPPNTLRPVRAIRADDTWCDDPSDRRYNRLIRQVPGCSEENLQRVDALYDVVVELGWNDQPVRRHAGSAIFWHGARPGFSPTAGCVATRLDVFAKVLPRLGAAGVVVVRR